MNVQELIDKLTDLDVPNAEIRFAYQASWPLRDKVAGVWAAEWYDERPDETRDQATDNIVYIVSGGQDSDHPYAPRAAFDGGF